ncbi:MAG: exodeoxyribonuclease VII small subunit [Kiritimatiellia bacterium]|jgi:exodeoxyribonuclease VII small subunit
MKEVKKTTEKAAEITIPDDLPFEKAVERLEAVIAAMEGGTEGLDAMVASFEEGQKLVKFCSAKLAEIERKVEILTKGADGKVKAQPFGEE